MGKAEAAGALAKNVKGLRVRDFNIDSLGQV